MDQQLLKSFHDHNHTYCLFYLDHPLIVQLNFKRSFSFCGRIPLLDLYLEVTILIIGHEYRHMKESEISNIALQLLHLHRVLGKGLGH